MGNITHLHEDEPDHAGKCGKNADSLVARFPGRHQNDVGV